jgi:hypothetical protein
MKIYWVGIIAISLLLTGMAYAVPVQPNSAEIAAEVLSIERTCGDFQFAHYNLRLALDINNSTLTNEHPNGCEFGEIGKEEIGVYSFDYVNSIGHVLSVGDSINASCKFMGDENGAWYVIEISDINGYKATQTKCDLYKSLDSLRTPIFILIMFIIVLVYLIHNKVKTRTRKQHS